MSFVKPIQYLRICPDLCQAHHTVSTIKTLSLLTATQWSQSKILFVKNLILLQVYFLSTCFWGQCNKVWPVCNLIRSSCANVYRLARLKQNQPCIIILCLSELKSADTVDVVAVISVTAAVYRVRIVLSVVMTSSVL